MAERQKYPPEMVGYRDMTGAPKFKVQERGLSPLQALQDLGRQVQDAGLSTGLPYNKTKMEQARDFDRRLMELYARHPAAAEILGPEIPEDVYERLDRAHDMGMRVPGSRGMHMDELENDWGIDKPEGDRPSWYVPRVGRHVDLNQDLIGPIAGHFGSPNNRIPIPLLINAHPGTTLVTSDSTANKPRFIAEELFDSGDMTQDDLNLFRALDDKRAAPYMNQWLRENGYTGLIYGNEIEGSPVSSSPQNKVVTDAAMQFNNIINDIPIAERPALINSVPNPSYVALDPADLRHMYQAGFNRHGLGYKLGVPLAGGLAALSMVGDDAEASELPIEKKTKSHPYEGQEIGPYEDDWAQGMPSDRLDQMMLRSPALRPLVEGMQDLLGFGPGVLVADPLDIPYKGLAKVREALSSQSTKPVETWVRDTLPSDLSWYAAGPVTGPVKAAGKEAKKRWGKAVETLVEALGD